MGRVEWIKLATRMPEDEKIKYILAQKDGYAMAWLWVRLLCRAGDQNDRGRIYVAPGVPYTAATLAAVFGMPKRIVTAGLKLLEQLGMIRTEPDALVIVNWGAHQNVEGMERIKGGDAPEDDQQNRKRARQREASRRYRDRKRDDADDDGEMTRHSDDDDAAMTHHPNGDDEWMTHHHSDDDGTMTRHRIDRDTEKDSEGEGDPESDSPTGDYQKKLGIDNAYTYSSRARAKTADIIAQHIVSNGIFPTNGQLLDAISEAFERGYSVNGVMREALAADGDLCRFFAMLMAAEPH